MKGIRQRVDLGALFPGYFWGHDIYLGLEFICKIPCLPLAKRNYEHFVSYSIIQSTLRINTELLGPTDKKILNYGKKASPRLQFTKMCIVVLRCCHFNRSKIFNSPMNLNRTQESNKVATFPTDFQLGESSSPLCPLASLNSQGRHSQYIFLYNSCL